MDIKKQLTELDKISENDKFLFEISEKCALREKKKACQSNLVDHLLVLFKTVFFRVLIFVEQKHSVYDFNCEKMIAPLFFVFSRSHVPVDSIIG